MTLHHVTYHVESGKLDGPDAKRFMNMLGFQEIEVPAWELDAAGPDLKVRWFRSGQQKVCIHLVGSDDGECDNLALGHFCVDVGRGRFESLRRSRFCVRDSGSHGRIWMQYANLRAEVRP